jgi:hypothetical protein
MISNATSEERSAVLEPSILDETVRNFSEVPSSALQEEEVCSCPYPHALWQCVQQLRAGEAIEQKIWCVLSLCGAATILYAAYCFFFRD